MNASTARRLANKAGCRLISKDIELTELNRILYSTPSSQESDPRDRLFADFALGRKLGAVSVIGTKQSLLQLHESCEMPN
jgi:hypothetical protein